jgi:hypothetical protein
VAAMDGLVFKLKADSKQTEEEKNKKRKRSKKQSR